MITRRDFLALSGLAAAEAGLGACMPLRPRKSARRAAYLRWACSRLQKPTGPGWNEVLRGRFRELECLTDAVLAVPSLNKPFAGAIKRRFWDLHGALATRTYSRTLAEAWRTFYELTSRLHEIRNARSRKSGLPVYAYNGHQHAARMWLDEAARRGTVGPLLHFDTHHDMRALVQPDRILEATRQLSNGKDSRKTTLRRLERLIYDPATPVSAGVLGRAVTDVIWAFPSWTRSAEVIQRPVFYAVLPAFAGSRRKFGLLHDHTEDDFHYMPGLNAGPWMEVAGLPPPVRNGIRQKRPFRLSCMQTYPADRNAVNNLLTVVPKGRFVLDIDVDYFMSIDADSGFRRPTGWTDRTARVAEYENRLRHGRFMLDRRIEEFQQLLETLRDAGRIPSIITIADSTFMPFASTTAGRAHWEYMPREFAGYVHWRVRRVLAAVYERYGIDAGT